MSLEYLQVDGDFRIGEWLVSPALNQISRNGTSARVEPKAMRVLVYLAEHNKIFGEQARLTLAGWDETSAQAIASDPKTPKEVLDYWLSPKNLRSALVPLLLENDSVPLGKLAELATALEGEWIDAMLASPRVRGSRQLLTDLSSNKELSGVQSARIQALLAYLAIMVTFVGFAVWFWGLRALPAARAGALIFLQPLSGLALAIVLLGDQVTPTFALGCGLVLVGVYLAAGRP